MKTQLNLLLPLLLMLPALSFFAGCTADVGGDRQQSEVKPSPDVLFGELFEKVQLSDIYEDSKTFVDSTPSRDVEAILRDYRAAKDSADFKLEAFVKENFTEPTSVSTGFRSDPSRSAEEHIEVLWKILSRQPDEEGGRGSLLPLPNAYIVPGGRFREIYYWDSYFTMLGLQESGHWDVVENMVNNFAYLIDTMGFIPNGNRTYYQSRSQPPFFAAMVELLSEHKGKATLVEYREQLQKEYDFWMEGADELSAEKPAYRRVVRMPDGSVLNRYWDDHPAPRPESFHEDVALVEAMGDIREEASEKYRHIRAAAESGWDFSSRWFRDGENMRTIHTTEIIPVDLNALLYNLERVLAEAYAQSGDAAAAENYRALAERRKGAINKCCWDTAGGFFHDYDFVRGTFTEVRSLAAVYPLYFGLATEAQAQAVAETIEAEFLKPGGVTTTVRFTGEQWDAPNGWAPLQWLTIQGLRDYGNQELANTIKSRWVELNKDVYQRSGKMVEKYNVYQLGLEGGGGEYPVQDGFGWTNGVLLKLLRE